MCVVRDQQVALTEFQQLHTALPGTHRAARALHTATAPGKFKHVHQWQAEFYDVGRVGFGVYTLLHMWV